MPVVMCQLSQGSYHLQHFAHQLDPKSDFRRRRRRKSLSQMYLQGAVSIWLFREKLDSQ